MSALGPREESNAFLLQMEKKNINTSTCLFRKEPTPSSYIIQSMKTSSRTIISSNAIKEISESEFIEKIEEILAEAPLSWVHFEGRNIEELGDIVFFSKLYAEKRGYKSPSEFLQSYKSKCKKDAILLCTWGENGATCLNGKKSFHAPALRIKPVDNVGAGDTFVAGIIFCISQGHTLQTALKFACELASKKVAQYGFINLGKDV
ncbi:Ribokinase-like protein [Sporodiniella umbellata]|nr:Ribokinase-like protein [Sporodiniella umbellata]